MQWNKINVDKKILVSNPMYLEIIGSVKLEINVKENINTKLVIIGNKNYDIKINIDNNSSLTVNSINKDNSVNVCINLNSKSSITYNHSVVSNINSINNFTINHLKNDSVSYLNNNGVNMNTNKLFITIDGVVNKSLKNIVAYSNRLWYYS